MKRQDGTRSTTPTTGTTTKSAGTTSKKKGAAALPAFDVQRELKPASDDIRRRAYEIYLDRVHRGEPGSPESDWQRAEHELARR